jgi:hypothetical protein
MVVPAAQRRRFHSLMLVHVQAAMLQDQLVLETEINETTFANGRSSLFELP